MSKAKDQEKIRSALASVSAPSSDFDLNQLQNALGTNKLRQAAVLIPMFYKHGELHVILTKRSSKLKHHPGQISFPGGKREELDRSLSDTALREAQEEIGLPASLVEILGRLANHQTVTGFDVSPFVAIVAGESDLMADTNEVEEIFSVPFQFLSETRNYSVQSRYWRGEKRSYYTVPFGPYYIWGATARMLFGLAHALEAACE